MGSKNSSETRVRPVFNDLLDRWPTGRGWLQELCELAAAQGGNATVVGDMGELLPTETPRARNARLGRVFERTIAPPGRFLHWLLEHPNEMQVADRTQLGASSPTAVEWRRRLFSDDSSEVKVAQLEGVTQLLQCGADNSRHQWWAFEGFTHTDCCLMTDSWLLLIEGKRTETVSASTRWFKHRSQLWRNVESAQVLAGGRQFGVILGVENERDGVAGMAEARSSLDRSLPHLSPVERASLSHRLLGFVVWSDLVERFGLSEGCLPDTVNSSPTDQT